MPSRANAISRPILLGVEVSDDHDSVVAEVNLQIGTENVVGIAAKTGDEVESAVAEATIRGVTRVTPIGMRVDATSYTTAGTNVIAVVVIEMEGMRRPLTGCALDDTQDGTAYARAALDAINRIVTSDRLMSSVGQGTIGSLGL